MWTKIYKKIRKKLGLDLKVCFVVFPSAQKSAQGPQDAKVKPPIMPNDRFASQIYKDPLATMPRIYNPEAMSNDRGPAAEGVAHKIRRTPAGGAGRDWGHSPFSAESEDSGRPHPCRQPLPKVSQKSPKKHRFSSLNLSLIHI